MNPRAEWTFTRKIDLFRRTEKLCDSDCDVAVRLRRRRSPAHGGIGPRSARLWKSELRISRGVCCRRYSCCCLKSHQLFAAAWKDPEITFVNSFRGPWKKCTNRRAFKVANAIPFRFFHAVTRTGRHCSQPRTQLALCRNGIFSGITPGPTESLRKG